MRTFFHVRIGSEKLVQRVKVGTSVFSTNALVLFAHSFGFVVIGTQGCILVTAKPMLGAKSTSTGSFRIVALDELGSIVVEGTRSVLVIFAASAIVPEIGDAELDRARPFLFSAGSSERHDINRRSTSTILTALR